MAFELYLIGSCLTLFAAMFLALEWGRRCGARWRARREGEGEAGLRAIEAALFALLGLLIAFTFQGAAARFDQRRELIVAEVNAIGTLGLRLDLLPPEVRAELRPRLRTYVDARLSASTASDPRARAEAAATARDLQTQLWRTAVDASAGLTPAAVSLVVSSLNETFDLATTRTMAQQMHPPSIVYFLVLALMLIAGVLAGWAMSGRARSGLHIATFAAVMALTFYVIIDLEFPRLGLLRVDDFDAVLRDAGAALR